MDKFFKSHDFIFHFIFQVSIMYKAYIKNKKLMQNGKLQHLFLSSYGIAVLYVINKPSYAYNHVSVVLGSIRQRA